MTDSILHACVQKLDDSIYELESPSQAGNLNSTPEYTLSMIEKAVNNATDFATIYNLYLGGEAGGDHVDVIKSANEFAQSMADVLINTKGITRLASDDDASDKIVGIAKAAGDVGLRFFENLQSYRLDLLQPTQRKDVAPRNNAQVRAALTKLSEVVDSLVPKGKAGALARAAFHLWTCKFTIQSFQLLWPSRMLLRALLKLPLIRRRRSLRKAEDQVPGNSSTSETTDGQRVLFPRQRQLLLRQTC